MQRVTIIQSQACDTEQQQESHIAFHERQQERPSHAWARRWARRRVLAWAEQQTFAAFQHGICDVMDQEQVS